MDKCNVERYILILTIILNVVTYHNTYFELHIIPFPLESFLFESLLVSLVLSVWILTNYNSSQFGYNVSNAKRDENQRFPWFLLKYSNSMLG